MAKKKDMTVTTLDLYNILRSKIGEGEAKALVEFVEHKITHQIEEEMIGLASRSDLLNTEGSLRNNITTLEVKIERTKADIIKWMFIFWAGQTGIMVGILALFNK